MTKQNKPLKAYENSEFLNSSDARIIRMLSEFIEPQTKFRKHKIIDTIVFFGSATLKSKKDRLNKYVTRNLSFVFHYFFMRKFWFAYLAKCLVVFPGGFGTMDEMFEILTLLQTGKIKKKMLLIVYDERFWKKIINLDGLIEHGVINKEDIANLSFCNSVDQAFSLITKYFEKYYLKKGAIENGEPRVDLK